MARRVFGAVVAAALALSVFASFLKADSVSDSSLDERRDGSACLWGGRGEQTTYLRSYSPLLAPEIPVQAAKDPNKIADPAYPMSPEEAISVIGADGVRYSYYFKKGTGYRKISEFRTVFEPMDEWCDEEVETIDPCTGRPVLRTVRVPTTTPFPVFHEKEFVRYEPVEVLIRVILPNVPTPDRAEGFLAPEGAATHFSSESR